MKMRDDVDEMRVHAADDATYIKIVYTPDGGRRRWGSSDSPLPTVGASRKAVTRDYQVSPVFNQLVRCGH